MKIPRTASAHLTLQIGDRRPLDAVLQLRIRCWFTRVACLIQRRDTPHTEVAPPTAPDPDEARLP